MGRVLNRCRGKKNMSVLFCARQTAERGEVGAGVTRLRAAAAAVGRAGVPGGPPGVAAGGGGGGGSLGRHSGGAGGRCPRATPTRPERAPGDPRGGARGTSAVRAPEQGKHCAGTLGPRARAFRRAGPASQTEGRGPAPPPWPGVPCAPEARRRRRSLGPRRPASLAPDWSWARPEGPAGLTASPGGQTEPRKPAGDLPGPPTARVTLPPNHLVGSGLTRVPTGSWASAGRRRVPRALGEPRSRPFERSQRAGAGPGRRRARPGRRGGAGSSPGLGRCPARPPGHPRAMAQWGQGRGIGGGDSLKGQRDGGGGEAQAPAIKGWGRRPAASPQARPGA